jgi:restriction system protein
MIPDYQTLMLPLLKAVSDGNEYKFSDVVEILANQFKLTKDERKGLLPSGQTFLFSNRVGWARVYLKKAGLLNAPKRGFISISKRGRQTLKENLSEITVQYLNRFEEFVQFKLSKDENNVVSATEIEESKKQTPEELIEYGYKSIRKSIEQEIISRLKSVSPTFFEKIVVELLVKMGYGGSIQDAGQAIGKGGDEGIDGIIKEDKLGLDVIYVQAKRWEGVVGRPEIQKFVGALAGQRAKKGVFITTSHYTGEAIAYAKKMDVKIILIDGEDLAQHMIDYNLGVSIQSTYEIKKIDSDYFEEE